MKEQRKIAYCLIETIFLSKVQAVEAVRKIGILKQNVGVTSTAIIMEIAA